ncbi:MAG: hypothetical protein NTY81_01620 [Candidatus Staskawiczbacteria bacterium]|nr:hypothetical protein [Candidatus Staskawiczbacteria bacterium]
MKKIIHTSRLKVLTISLILLNLKLEVNDVSSDHCQLNRDCEVLTMTTHADFIQGHKVRSATNYTGIQMVTAIAVTALIVVAVGILVVFVVPALTHQNGVIVADSQQQEVLETPKETPAQSAKSDIDARIAWAHTVNNPPTDPAKKREWARHIATGR